jgi:hypothetical protein
MIALRQLNPLFIESINLIKKKAALKKLPQKC